MNRHKPYTHSNRPLLDGTDITHIRHYIYNTIGINEHPRNIKDIQHVVGGEVYSSTSPNDIR